MQVFKLLSERNHSDLIWICQTYSVINSSNDIKLSQTVCSNLRKVKLSKDSNLQQRKPLSHGSKSKQEPDPDTLNCTKKRLVQPDPDVNLDPLY